MQPKGQAVFVTVRVVPASGTKTLPFNGSTVIECALEVAGRSTRWITAPLSLTMSKNLPVVLVPVT